MIRGWGQWGEFFLFQVCPQEVKANQGFSEVGKLSLGEGDWRAGRCYIAVVGAVYCISGTSPGDEG